MSKYIKYVEADRMPENSTIIRYSIKEIATDQEVEDWSGDKLASYSVIEQTLKSLTGRVLTVIDASIPEGKQNKSIKDLIRKEFMHEFIDIGDLLFDKQRVERAIDGEYDDLGEMEISAEEALEA